MATIALRKNAWDNASVRDRTIFMFAAARLELGVPALYQAPGGAVWLIFDDHRIDLTDVAYLGCLVKGIATNTTYVLPLKPDGSLDKAQLRSDVVTWVLSRVVLPKDIEYTEDGNPWMETLAAQNAPTAVAAGAQVPDTWTPVEAT